MNFLKKLTKLYIWKRVFYERLSEPIHLNFISLIILLFGNYRQKCNFDLILRPHHAYCLLNAADAAISEGKHKVSIIEFGVATGAGLVNLQKIAKKITAITGVSFNIYGFDTGEGMPPPESYKDHPELYQEGDFPMDFDSLHAALDSQTKLILGPIEKTIPEFLEQDFQSCPIAFISIDVDYYSSTVEALNVLSMEPNQYLSRVSIYLDDLEDMSHNSWCGELAAINEFSAKNEFRKIEKHAFLRGYRIFKNARWIDHIFHAHILDHPVRSIDDIKKKPQVILENPYL
jgi:hypothetical protein